jgi:hypothetical protein
MFKPEVRLGKWVAVMGGVVLIAVSLVLLSGIVQPVKAQASIVCRMMIDPTVQTGPKAGTRLEGEIKLTIDPMGIAEGTFTSKDQQQTYKVTGAFLARSINFTVELGKDQYLYAMGNTVTDVKDNCGTNWGGIFEGLGGMGIWPETYIQKPGH